MSGIKNKRHTAEYVYDFAVDGGTKDANIVLSDKDGKAPIPIGAIVTGVTAKVLTAPLSAGAATVSWGNDDDEDGYSGTTIAKATLAINTVFNGWDNAAALLWDDTNDHPIHFPVLNADDGDFIVLISTADLTAGKIVFFVDYYLPEASA
jgi:hypothetical protein